MPDLLIGCPVSQRQWVLPDWFLHVREAARHAGLDYGFVFVGNPQLDSSFDVIFELAENDPCTVVRTEEPARTDVRKWLAERLALMADLRNRMLAEVRRQSPRLFLSLDSDVLVHPMTIANLRETVESNRAAAVGGRCYMQSGTRYPSWARRGREGWVHGTDMQGVFEVDAIMAIKLMQPAAYHVDYVTHPWGEDVGWAEACAERKVRLMWDGRVVSKHVRDPEKLHQVDLRCGY